MCSPSFSPNAMHVSLVSETSFPRYTRNPLLTMISTCGPIVGLLMDLKAAQLSVCDLTWGPVTACHVSDKWRRHASFYPRSVEEMTGHLPSFRSPEESDGEVRKLATFRSPLNGPQHATSSPRSISLCSSNNPRRQINHHYRYRR